MKKLLLFAALLPSLAACAAVPIAAAAAVGVWSYDQNNQTGGSLPVEAERNQVWAAMKQVANERATGPLEINEGAQRIEGEVADCKTYMTVLPFPSTSKVYEIKVRCIQGVRPRSDVAKELAEDIASRL